MRLKTLRVDTHSSQNVNKIYVGIMSAKLTALGTRVYQGKLFVNV